MKGYAAQDDMGSIFIDISCLIVYYITEKISKEMVFMEITVGTVGKVGMLVEPEDTALSVGSGSLRVFATPCMAALMEGAACEALEGFLPEGKTSVGTELNICHISATPVGMEVTAEATVTAVEGNTVTFSLIASDEAGKIGEGTHKRVIVSEQKFLDKTYQKL